MEDSGLISKDKSKVESVFLTDIFEEQCPIYMSYGMTYDEFWNDSPYKTVFYRKAKEIQTKQKDEEFWMQGVYVYEALCRVSPILHAFAKSGTKPLPYLKEPLLFNSIDHKETKEDEEQRIKNERLIAQVHFDRWAKATAKRFENKS